MYTHARTKPRVDTLVVMSTEPDYLEQDAPIRGQNFACVSFVSPEKVIRQREVFTFGKFMADVAKDTAEMLDTLKQKYANDAATCEMIALLRERHAHLWDNEQMQEQYLSFQGLHSDELNEEYHRQHGFQTSVRGIKIRGVCESYEEALKRCKHLHERDPKFAVYVAQVGCWCPWDPSPEEIRDCEYHNQELNTIVKKYKENAEKKDTFYFERKMDKVRDMRAGVASPSTMTLEAQPDSDAGAGAVADADAVLAESDKAYRTWQRAKRENAASYPAP